MHIFLYGEFKSVKMYKMYNPIHKYILENLYECDIFVKSLLHNY